MTQSAEPLLSRSYFVQTLVICRPDDWHVHFRDGVVLEDTVNATALHFARALVMPNLKPALTTLASLLAYRTRILAALKKTNNFEPFMTFYLNEHLPMEDLAEASQYPFILGAKLYPAGATTNASEGAASIKALYPHFAFMEEKDWVLQIHGEENAGDIFDREAQFIENQLMPLTKAFPRLRIVLEHVSTQKAVDFVKAASNQVAATVTPQHLLFNRNDLFVGGIKPHLYCLPILKRQSDQRAIQEVVLSGHPKFFAGTDSAPHPKNQKEGGCGCAGVYSAPFALPLYTHLFDTHSVLNRLEPFVSQFGADFYQVPCQKTQMKLIKKQQVVPDVLTLGDDWVVPILAGQTLAWSVHV